jgi:hypothetical protein
MELKIAASTWLRDAERIDVALYAAVAATPTPALDDAVRRLTTAADHARCRSPLRRRWPRLAARRGVGRQRWASRRSRSRARWSTSS